MNKSKMISFRLSGEEYRILQESCSRVGARSVSDLCRGAVRRIILEDNFYIGSREDDLGELKIKFNALKGEVERLSWLVKSSTP